jgi:pilus assembly protein CpaB
MMEQRALLISTGLSMLAMYLVYQYVAAEDLRLEQLYGKATSVNVVRAKRDILQYETIRPTDVEMVTVPKAMEPPGYVFNQEDVYDAVAAVPVSKGEFILDNKIISRNVYSGLDSQISRDRRAISIPATVRSALGYLLRPGNRVDLAAQFEYKGTSGTASESRVFLQDLLVLASGRTIQADPPRAVDQNIIGGLLNSSDSAIPREPTELRETLNYAKTDSNFQTLTLEVTPQQAQTIVYILSVYGDSLTVLLRHSDDRQLERSISTNLVDVMGQDSYMARGNKAPPTRTSPRIKYFDIQGGQSVPVREGGY